MSGRIDDRPTPSDAAGVVKGGSANRSAYKWPKATSAGRSTRPWGSTSLCSLGCN